MSPLSLGILSRRRACDPSLPRECSGIYLIDWDGDSTGEKVGLVFTWLLLAAILVGVIYFPATFLWTRRFGNKQSRNREARTAAAITQPKPYAGRHWTVRDAQGQVSHGGVSGAPPDYDELAQTMPAEKAVTKEMTTEPPQEIGAAV